jgi:hypothetical protein
MSALAVDPLHTLPSVLPGAFGDTPSPTGIEPHPHTVKLVRALVRDLLIGTPEFHALDPPHRVALAHNLVHVGSYLAECVRDDWYQSQEHLGQRPVLLERRPVARAQAAGDDFKPAAASQVGTVTEQTLRAIAFPVFVADLIRGTFNAIQESNQKQMESYMQLLENVGKTVDQFMRDNVSDDAARSWLVDKYPQHLRIADGKVAPSDRQSEGGGPDFTADLDLTESVDASDGDAVEETLVPAARRKLAQMRLKMLSTLVLMGINRIVVTGGKIRATMGFHINTHDIAHAESSSSFDTRIGTAGSFGVGPWSASLSVSVAYVSSTKADSSAELNTQTDLTGEVEIHFQSDYFPIERFADSAGIDRIRGNTPVPAANTPTTPGRDTIPWGDTAPVTPAKPPAPVAPAPAVAPATPPSPKPPHAPLGPTPPTPVTKPGQIGQQPQPTQKPAPNPPQPTPTPQPQPQPTPTAQPQPQPTPTAQPQPQPTPTAQPQPQPTPTPSS